MFTTIYSSGLEVGNDPSIFEVGEEYWTFGLPARKEGTEADASVERKSISAQYLDWFRGGRGESIDRRGRNGGSVSEPRGALLRSFSSGRRRNLGNRDDRLQGDQSLSLAVLEALVNKLEAPLRGFHFIQKGRNTRVLGVAGAESTSAYGPVVSLDLASARTLQRALRSQACASSVPRDGRVDTGGNRLEMRNGIIFRFGSGDGVATCRRFMASFIGEEEEKPGASKRELMVRLRRQSRSVTALRLRGDAGLFRTSSGISPSSPSVDVRTFPALQELWLEEVPLKSVEGLFTLRLQLKLLSFCNTSLETISTLLAPHVALDDQLAVAAAFGTVGSGVGGRTSDSGRSASVPRSRTDFLLGQEDQKEDDGELRERAFSGAVDDLARLKARLGTGTPALRWALLQVLSVRWTGLAELDPSLRLLPNVRRISLAYNRIHSIDFFQDCASLEDLDLSFNKIRSMENAPRVLGNLRVLGLRGNRITRTIGLDRVFSLEELDLSLNSIEALDEVARLSVLPMLSQVEFAGNPLEADEGKDYRVTVLSLLYQKKTDELERAVRISNARNGFCLSSLSSNVQIPAVDSREAVGIVLDGQRSSRAELIELNRLTFADAVKAHPVPYSGGPLPGPALVPIPFQTDPEGNGGEHAHGSKYVKGGGDREEVVVVDRLSGDIDHGDGTAVNMTALVNESAAAAVEREKRRLAGMTRGKGRKRRGRRRRSGTRAAAIDGPRSPPGDGEISGGHGGTPEHLSISFCTVPLPAEEDDKKKEEDDENIDRPMESAGKSVGSIEAIRDVGRVILDPGDTSHANSRASQLSNDETGQEGTSEAVKVENIKQLLQSIGESLSSIEAAHEVSEAPQANSGASQSPNDATGQEGTFEAVRVEESESLSGREGGNSSRHPETSNSPEVDSPGNDLNGNERNPIRVRHSRPPALQPSVPKLGESSTNDRDPEEHVSRREQQPPRLQQQVRSRDSGDPSNIEASTEKPGDECSSSPVDDLAINDGGRSTVADVDQGAAGLTRSSARSLVNVAAAATGGGGRESGNEGTSRERSRTIEGECGLLVASSGDASASQQLPGLLDAHGESRGQERMARSAELAGRLRAVVSEEAGSVLSVATAIPVAELAPASASEQSPEDPKQLTVDRLPSIPRYSSRRRGNGEPFPDGPPAVADGQLQPNLGGVEERGGCRRDVVESPSGGSGTAGANSDGGVVSGNVSDGYRGAEAYAKLLIVEHLELYLQQQVFLSGAVPYLSYSEAPLQPAMNAHREQSKTVPDKVVAVFRETVLPCMPEDDNLANLEGQGESTVWDRRSAEDLAAAGMARVARLRGLDGEDRGVTMGEVACIIVITEKSLYVIDGVFAKKEALFSEAPRPRVLLVLPLGCLERTTIGFRFQKLELHMNVSSCLSSTLEVGDRRGVSQGSAMAAAAEAVSSGGGFFWGGVLSTSQASFIGGNGYGGGRQATDERVSIVVLTRDRSRTVNLHQTLEPVMNKARHTLGLPSTLVNNRDEATLEAIAQALPSSAVPPRRTPIVNIPPISPRDQPSTLGGLLSMRSSGASDIGGGDPSPAEQKSPIPTKTGDAPPPSPSKSVMAMDEDGGEVVVFQLLMQRFELRPWVVAPRTLVASKEQLALMDEDHSRMQALPQQQQQQQQQWQITTRMTTVVSPPTTPSSSRAGASRLFGGAYNSRVDSGSRRNSFAGDASSLPGSPNSGRSGTNPAGSSVDESGGREMTCLEAVDLGDVLGVYQENSAPEQVVIEYKNRRNVNRRRQWRLQCRTRSSAETITSTVLRLSQQRAEQRGQRQTARWWRR